MSSNLNALSTQRVGSALVSAYGVCILSISLEVVCVDSEEKSLIKYFAESGSKHLKTVYCFIMWH